MKTSKWTLAILLSTCLAFPAMGYTQQSKKKAPKKLSRVEENIKAGGTNPLVQKRIERKVVEAGILKGEYIIKKNGTLKNLKELERKYKKQTKKIAKTKQAATNVQTEEQQPADFCEKNCTPKFGPDLYDAEMDLQKIRDTYDPSASFEKYPWLLYEHSDACQYSKKQPIPGNNTKNAPTPDEK